MSAPQGMGGRFEGIFVSGKYLEQFLSQRGHPGSIRLIQKFFIRLLSHRVVLYCHHGHQLAYDLPY